jgi:hypothetical protein
MMAEYEISLQGHPGGDTWAGWLDGLDAVSNGNGVTVLRGTVSAVVLLTLLSKLRRASIPVLSVTMVERTWNLEQERLDGYGLAAHSLQSN